MGLKIASSFMDRVLQIMCAAAKSCKKKKKPCWGIFISMSALLLSEMDSVMITVTLNIM